MRTSWAPVIEHAAEWVSQFDGSVTLRQVFYHLVATQQIPNKGTAYTYLSKKTAQGRRDGSFPVLVDKTRNISRHYTVAGVSDALDGTIRDYRLDRTAGQEWQVWLGAEKRGMVGQLDGWFGYELGLPIVAFGGYVSQSLADQVRQQVQRDGRPAVFIYAGDFDPSGIHIPRDFENRTKCWDCFERVALNPEHIDEYELPENPGKWEDTRSTGFVAEFGRHTQVEVDALAPAVLKELYATAIFERWDWDVHEDVLQREAEGRRTLIDFVEGF